MTPELSNSGVPQSAVDVLVQLYTQAADRIRDQILKPPGKSVSSQEWNQARAASTMAQIEQILTALKFDAAKWIGPNLKQAMIDGVTRANQQMKALGVLPDNSPLKGSFNLIDKDTMAIFAKDIYGDLITKAADSLGRNANALLRQTAQRNITEGELDRILAGGVIDGQPRDVIERLRKALDPVDSGQITIKDKNGEDRNFDAGAYARMVVRTKTREATTAARHDRLQQEGINLVSIVGRVSGNFCTAYLGMVFSLDGKSTKYPALDDLPNDGPPFHPNCSKSTRPFVEDLATDKELDQADGVDGADALVGVSANEAQKLFTQKGIGADVKASYATTAAQLFGKK